MAINKVQFIVEAIDKASPSIQKIQKEVNTMTSKVTNQFSKTTQAIKDNADGFKNLGVVSGVAFGGLILVTNSAIKANNELQNSLVGLKSIAEGTGKDFDKAKSFIQDFTKDGLITTAESATALKNLFARGFDLDQSIKLMNRFKDASAFGRQSALSLGEAVRGATEGLKNANSMLVDNAGITKNVAKMWEDYAKKIGVQTDSLTLAQKREAEFQGVMEESRFQIGDASKLTETLAGKQAMLGASIQILQQNIGGALAPAMSKILEVITPIITSVYTWIKQNPELTSKIILVVGAIAGLVAGLVAFGLAIGPVIASVKAIGVVLGALFSPIGLIIAGIVALAYAWTTNFGGIRDKTFEIINEIKPYFLAFVEILKASWKILWADLGTILSGQWEVIKGIFNIVLGVFRGIMIGWQGILKGDWKMLWEGIKMVLVSAWEGIKTIINGVFSIIKGLFSIFGRSIEGLWKALWEGIKIIISSAFKGIQFVIENGFILVYKIITGFIKIATDLFMDLGQKAIQWGSNLIEMFGQGILSGYEDIKKSVNTIANTISDYLGFHSPSKKGPGKDADKWMPNLMDMLADGLSDTTKIERASLEIAKSIGKGMNKEQLEQLSTDLRNTVNDISSTLKTSFGEIESKIGSQKDKLLGLKDEYGRLKDKLKEVGTEGAKELAKIQEQIDKQTKTISSIREGGTVEVAKRALEIEKEIANLKKDGGTTDEEKTKNQEKIKQLEIELQLAKTAVSQVDIEKQRIENAKTETQLIIERSNQKLIEATDEKIELQKTYNEKKRLIDEETKKIQEQMTTKRSEIMKEYNLYSTLLIMRTDLDNQYFSLFQNNINAQIDKTKEAIDLMNTLNVKTGGKSTGLIDGARANGGPVFSGKNYLVGEKGPELFVPNRSGTIIPNGQTSGNTINVNMGGVVVNNKSDADYLANKVIDKVTRQLQLYKLGIS